MDGIRLLFEGGEHPGRLAILLGALVTVLLAHGIWQLAVRRRLRAGLLSLSAATGAIVPALLVDAVLRRRRGDADGARDGLLAGAALTLLAGAAIGLYLWSPASQTLWTLATAWTIIVAVGVFYVAAYAHLGVGRLSVLLALRCLAIGTLVGLLFKPALSIPPSEVERLPHAAFLLDRSGSMNTVDFVDVPSRYRQGAHALASQSERIAEHFQPGWRHFAMGFQRVSDVAELSELAPAGAATDGTDLAKAIARAANEYAAGDLVGIVVISDGIQTTGTDLLAAIRQAGVPIYTIAVGTPHAERAAPPTNARILAVEAPLAAIKDNKCTVTVRVQAAGMRDKAVRVQLLQGQTALAEHSLVPAGDDVTQSVPLTFVPSDDNAPEDAGPIRRLTVKLTAANGETAIDDNNAEVHVLVTQPRIRVLYVESIRPEYRFLSHQLRRDPNVQLITLVHLSEKKFVASGKIGGRSLAGLPRNADELGLFDVVIMGDVAAGLWAGKLEMLDTFVRSGKGLLMLGGRRTFGPGGYGATPLAKTLPVVCGPTTIGQDARPFVPQLTADGAQSRLLADTQDFMAGPGGEPAKLALPELTGCVRTAGLRPGATALAIHPKKGPHDGDVLVLAASRVGAGRAVAFTADTTWRWQMQLEGRGKDSPYARFWRQMVRHLADVETTDEPAGATSVLGRLDKPYVRTGKTVSLLARVQGEKGAVTGASVNVVVVPDGDVGEQTLALQPGAGRGEYEAKFTPSDAGACTLRFVATGPDGTELGVDTLPLLVVGRNVEAERLAYDDETLRQIAEFSGGRSYGLQGLPDAIDHLIARTRGTSAAAQATTVPLYNFTVGFLLFVALLTVEWLLRRRWQLQ